MKSIKINPIEYWPDPDGWFGYYSLDEDDYGRYDATSINSPAFLLDEAIRFYNYGIPSSRYTQRCPMVKNNWIAINHETISSAIRSFSILISDSFVSMVSQLFSNLNSHIINKNQLPAKYQVLTTDNKGMVCASLLLSNDFRNVKKLGLLAKFPEIVHFRKLEDTKSTIDELGRHLGISEHDRFWKSYYVYLNDKYYGHFTTNPDHLFYPRLGGKYTIIPREIVDTNRRTHEYRPGHTANILSLIYPYRPSLIGATEKIYHAAASTVFKYAHGKINSYEYKDIRYGHPFARHSHQSLVQAQRVLPVYPKNHKSNSTFLEWEQNLNRLKQFFIDTTLKPSVSTYSGEGYSPGIITGMPVALMLIDVLESYLLNIKIRAFICSMHRSITRIYEEINGYLAIALLESLSGQKTTSLTLESCLDNPQLVGLLKEARRTALRDIFDRWSFINEMAMFELDKVAEQPMIKRDEYGAKHRIKKQKPTIDSDLTVNGFISDYIPRHPIITKEFYQSLGQEDEGRYGNLFGASFAAQVHIFVAQTILQKTLNSQFAITAGSYIWGGRKPPHKTHRHGVNFDFAFGPVIVPWPRSKLKDKIGKLRRLRKGQIPDLPDLSGKEYLERVARKKHRYLLSNPEPVAICYTNQQVDSERGQRTIVFKSLVTNKLINPGLSKVKKYCDAILSGKKEVDLVQEEKDYDEVEKTLLGTPHFMSPEIATRAQVPEDEIVELEDMQKTHFGHLSILLSFASTMIFATPIIHFRSMRAIRKVFNDSEHFMFGVEWTEEIERQLELNESLPLDILNGFEKRNYTFVGGVPRVKTIEEKKEWLLIEHSGDRIKIKKESRKENEFRINVYTSHTKFTARLLKDTKFYFLPSDHHHHWHINYHRDNDLEKLQSAFEFWLSLGVDLRPFLQYLKNYDMSRAQHPYLSEITSDYRALAETLETYCMTYAEMYGEGEDIDEQQMQNRENANELIAELFEVFREGDLIKPTIRVDHIHGRVQDSELHKKAIRPSQHLIRLLLPVLRSSGLVEPDEIYSGANEKPIASSDVKNDFADTDIPVQVEQTKEKADKSFMEDLTIDDSGNE